VDSGSAHTLRMTGLSKIDFAAGFSKDKPLHITSTELRPLEGKQICTTPIRSIMRDMFLLTEHCSTVKEMVDSTYKYKKMLGFLINIFAQVLMIYTSKNQLEIPWAQIVLLY
jgi:hypothetical protein